MHLGQAMLITGITGIYSCDKQYTVMEDPMKTPTPVQMGLVDGTAFCLSWD